MADEAMYVAKRSGTNQFSVWGDARQDGKEWSAHSNCQWWTKTNQAAILADKMQDERIGSGTLPP
jgi:hypothetical protein